MINNTMEAIVSAKETISNLLEKGEIPITYNHGGRKTKGDIIEMNGIRLNPNVLVRSHTGKQYRIQIWNILNINTSQSLFILNTVGSSCADDHALTGSDWKYVTFLVVLFIFAINT